MFLCGGGSSLQALMDELEKTNWYRQLPFTRKPSVHHIRPDQVVGIKDLTGNVNDHTYITALGLLRVGLDTLQFSEKDGGSIRDKIDRMLQV
jgi:cell division protein FtsA